MAAAATRTGKRSGSRRRHPCLRIPPGMTGSYQTIGKARECLENPGRDVFLYGVSARGSLPTRPLHIVVPIRWVRDLQPPRSHWHRPGPTGSIGQETGQEFRSGWRIIPLLIGRKYICHSRKIFVLVATERHRGSRALPSRRRQIEYRYVRVREL